MTNGGNEAGGWLKFIQGVVGLFAGIAALIYLTGGAVLALRLAFLDLPALGVVGQLPQQFLFSLGVTQVVVPALLLGIVAGLAQLMQSPDAVFDRSHHAWDEAKGSRELRRAFVLFFLAAPLVLVSPGATVAILRDDQVQGDELLVGLFLALTLSALVLWVWAARKARGAQPPLRPRGDTKLSFREWCVFAGGGVVALIPGVWVATAERDATSASTAVAD